MSAWKVHVEVMRLVNDARCSGDPNELRRIASVLERSYSAWNEADALRRQAVALEERERLEQEAMR